MRNMVIPGARIVKIVVMKLTAPPKTPKPLSFEFYSNIKMDFLSGYDEEDYGNEFVDLGDL